MSVERTPTAAGTRLAFCAACDVELSPRAERCPRCDAPAMTIRTGVDGNLGRVLDDRYELRGFLGAGGMGTVYRAWQRSVKRDVAVKLVHDRYRRDLTWIRRFLREARLSSRLHHPNIVGVVDFGQTAEGDLFLAMELLQGRVLADVMARDGRFDRRRVIRLGVQICDALAAAHDRRIVHRDLKPQNIFVLAEPVGRDFVKLLDFGLARSLVDDGDQASQSSRLLGTPYYMAPELFSRQPPSVASDLYAVGVILCEAHLGRRLFTSESFAALQVEKAALIDLPADVDPALYDLLRALVEPNPARRPRHAAEVSARLEACASEILGPVAFAYDLESGVTPTAVAFTTPLTTAPLPSRSRRRWWLAAPAAVAIAGALALAWTRARPSPLPTVMCTAVDDRLADPGTGEAWARAWRCPTASGAPLYEHANGEDHVGYVASGESEIVCFRHGAAQAGGDDVWYYAQGDWTAPGREALHGWGYLAAVNVRATAHPVPGIPACGDRRAADELGQQVERVVAANPGARAIDRNQVALAGGIVMTLPMPGEKVALGPGEVASPGVASCPGHGLCVYEHAQYAGVRLRLDGCGSFDLRDIVGADGLRWDDRISSWHSAQPGGQAAVAYELDDGAATPLFSIRPGSAVFVGEDANDRADRVDTCR